MIFSTNDQDLYGEIIISFYWIEEKEITKNLFWTEKQFQYNYFETWKIPITISDYKQYLQQQQQQRRNSFGNPNSLPPTVRKIQEGYEEGSIRNRNNLSLKSPLKDGVAYLNDNNNIDNTLQENNENNYSHTNNYYKAYSALNNFIINLIMVSIIVD
jgi:hypothetical protein